MTVVFNFFASEFCLTSVDRVHTVGKEWEVEVGCDF